ncbi:MAG: hypothetical protein RI907_3052 [Pseudomonadota bacterium]|jgi:hypothetical protein
MASQLGVSNPYAPSDPGFATLPVDELLYQQAALLALIKLCPSSGREDFEVTVGSLISLERGSLLDVILRLQDCAPMSGMSLRPCAIRIAPTDRDRCNAAFRPPAYEVRCGPQSNSPLATPPSFGSRIPTNS